MGTITLQIPQSGQPNSTEDVKVSDDFTTLQTLVNGNIDTANLSPTANIAGSQLSPSAGIAASQCAFSPGNAVGSVYAPAIANAATSTSGINVITNSLYVAQVAIYGNALTGVSFYNTSISGNLIAALYNSGGSQVAVSSSTVMTGSPAPQRIPFTTPYTPAAGVYYLGVVYSNGSIAHPAGGFPLCASARIAQGGFAAPASITPPTVPAASDLIPLMATY